jgi:hypothetical protein
VWRLTDRVSAAATRPFGLYLTFLTPEAPVSCMRLLGGAPRDLQPPHFVDPPRAVHQVQQVRNERQQRYAIDLPQRDRQSECEESIGACHHPAQAEIRTTKEGGIPECIGEQDCPQQPERDRMSTPKGARVQKADGDNEAAHVVQRRNHHPKD